MLRPKKKSKERKTCVGCGRTYPMDMNYCTKCHIKLVSTNKVFRNKEN